MALCPDEFLCLSEEERRTAEKLPLDSPQRKSMLARKLAEIRANSQHSQPKGKTNARRLQRWRFRSSV
jgi:hypothetical protein